MKKIIIGVFALVIGLVCVQAPTPVFADGDDGSSCTCADGSEGVPTAIIGNGCSCDDGKGSGVKDVLNLVVDIMTVGIGILGVIGITLVGVQYLTAGGEEEKVRKAKRRMFEIVIGLVAYVILYAVLRWLLPSFGETEAPADTPPATSMIIYMNSKV